MVFILSSLIQSLIKVLNYKSIDVYCKNNTLDYYSNCVLVAATQNISDQISVLFDHNQNEKFFDFSNIMLNLLISYFSYKIWLSL